MKTLASLLKMAGDEDEEMITQADAPAAEKTGWLKNFNKLFQQIKRVDNLTGADLRPSWMVQLQGAVGGWLQMLPKKLDRLKRTQKNIRDPLYRYFEREVSLLKFMIG